MIQLDNKMLRQLQMLELEMLIEVDRICRKHNIQYNIIGGTLLGSVRHKGFIPWDDDADVAMLRADYERFKKICRAELEKFIAIRRGISGMKVNIYGSRPICWKSAELL